MRLGETFVGALSSASVRSEHLHVVISNPTSDDEVAVVNLSTKRWDSDTCCVLDAGDHPWVRHETVALYSQALLIPVQKLALGLNRHVLNQHDSVDPEVLKRLQDGALDCEQTPPLVEVAVRATFGL